MKKLLFVTMLICAPVLVFAAGERDDWSFGIPIKGNGTIERTEIPLTPFSGIFISGNAVVNYHQSANRRAIVNVDSNLAEHVKVHIKNGVLHIGTKWGRYYSFTQFTVDVYAPTLAGVSIYGTAQFAARSRIVAPSFKSHISGRGKMEGVFQADDFSANISGAGTIDAQLVSKNVKADVSGTSGMILRGTSDNMDISISGSGLLNARELRTRNANVRISGAGALRLWVLDNLKATVSGAGRIRYRGRPAIDFKGSGAGRLESE